MGSEMCIRDRFFLSEIRRALCPGRVRSCHHPSSHVPGCSFCSFYSFLSIPGAIGSKSVLLDGSLAAPWRLLGGSSAATRWIVVMGRDFLYTQKTSGFTLRFAFGWRANGPRPPTYPPHPPTYGFMAQFFTTCIIFSYFFEKCFPEYTVH